MPCIFCYNTDEGEDNYICSDCTQKLLRLDIEKLKQMYKLMLEKYPEKAKMLLHFTGPIVQAKEGCTFVRKRPVTIKKQEQPIIRRRRPLQTKC